MARMRPPKIDEKLIPVIPADELRKLLDTCAGRSFEDRRDATIIRMFIATGARLAEIANLRLQEIDLDRTEAWVVCKGRRARTGAFPQSGQSARPLPARAGSPQGGRPRLGVARAEGATDRTPGSLR
jgi:site-specific recombinase XerC